VHCKRTNASPLHFIEPSSKIGTLLSESDIILVYLPELKKGKHPLTLSVLQTREKCVGEPRPPRLLWIHRGEEGVEHRSVNGAINHL
jgi:hypothetical protein